MPGMGGKVVICAGDGLGFVMYAGDGLGFVMYAGDGLGFVMYAGDGLGFVMYAGDGLGRVYMCRGWVGESVYEFSHVHMDWVPPVACTLFGVCVTSKLIDEPPRLHRA